MKRSLAVLLCSLVAVPAAALEIQQQRSRQHRTAPEAAPADVPQHGILADAALGAPVVEGRVAVWPLVARAKVADARYATLDESLRAGKLVVEETGDSGSVNQLKVTNRGDAVVYLMAGEVLLGGKQDRIVGRNMLVPAGARSMEVPVYCVEHGRWQKKTERFETAGRVAHSKLRQKASAESQQEVWGEVKATNARRKVANPTETYRASLEKTADTAAIGRTTGALRQGTAGVRDMAGVVIAVDGELVAVEWFAAPALYRKLEAKLLESYVAEAMDRRPPATALPAPTKATVSTFLNEADGTAARAERSGGEGKVYLFESADVDGQAIFAADKKPVHKSWYKKR